VALDNFIESCQNKVFHRDLEKEMSLVDFGERDEFDRITKSK
jgi:hypothetical protein